MLTSARNLVVLSLMLIVASCVLAPAAFADPTISTDASHDFGTANVGGSAATYNAMVSNDGAVMLLMISAVGLSGADLTAFSISSENCTVPGVVAPTFFCMVNVDFSPATIGAKSASLDITSDDPVNPSVSIPLTGNGANPGASAAPASLDFGSQGIAAGSTASQQVTLTSIGATGVTVGGVSVIGADSALFTIDAESCTGAGSIAGPGTCTVDVSFDPDTVGAKTATLRIGSNANSSPHDIALTGTGTSADAEATPASISFGNQDVASGASGAQSVTLTSTGTSNVTPGAPTLIGATPGDFAIGFETCSVVGPMPNATTCSVQVTFDPSAAGAIAATLRIPSDGTSAPHDIPLMGTGTVPDASISAGPLAFGSQQIAAGATATQQVTFTSSGGSPVTPTAVSLIGTDPTEFTIGADTCTTAGPITLPGTCTVDIAFDPTAIGAKSATLQITSNATTAPHTVALTGTATNPGAIVAPATIAFGNQDIAAGAAAAQAVTLTSAGTTPLTMTSVSLIGAGAAAFTVTSDGCTPAGALVAPGPCVAYVSFDPAAVGAHTATLRFTSDSATSPHDVALTGTGTTAVVTAPALPTPPTIDFANELRSCGFLRNFSSTITGGSAEAGLAGYSYVVREVGSDEVPDATVELGPESTSITIGRTAGPSYEVLVSTVDKLGRVSEPAVSQTLMAKVPLAKIKLVATVAAPTKVKRGKSARVKIKIVAKSACAPDGYVVQGLKLKIKGKGLKFGSTSVKPFEVGNKRSTSLKVRFKKSGKVKMKFSISSANAGGASVKRTVLVKR